VAIDNIPDFLDALVCDADLRAKWVGGDKDGALAGTGLSDELKQILKDGPLSKVQAEVAKLKGNDARVIESSKTLRVYGWIK
jgi:hypothetical protein